MHILVTGGAGFIGSHMIRYLLKTYPTYRIINFDKLTYAGNLDTVRDVADNPQYTFVQGDICDPQALAQVIEQYQVDVILNYAAETHVDRSIDDPEAFLRTDIFGTYHLLEAVKKFHIKKFIQISTDEVFGSIASGQFNEESCFRPNSPYSASKAGGDLLCRAYGETYGVPVVVTHSCNVYGPYQYPEKIVPLFITNLLQAKKVPIYGDGKNIREWIYVTDHCRAIDSVIHRAEPGRVYNIGTGNEVQNIDLTKKLLDAVGAREDMIEYVTDRQGHDRRYAIDASKLRQDLGWEPQTPFDDGIRQTVAWYRDNEAWWKKFT